MIGAADREIRLAAFSWLSDLRLSLGEVLPREVLLAGFEHRGRRVGLMSPAQGIWKPAVCELPLSIVTTVGGPYADAFDSAAGRIRYAYRGTDPAHRDNAGLRRAMRERIPLVYLHAVARGRYVAAYPVFVVGDDPPNLRFAVQVDDASTLSTPSGFDAHLVAEEADARRAYITTTVQRRLHQAAFRDRVLRAYREMCALCRLRHPDLLDAAHITADSDLLGEPVVSNGLSLCKLHHAAFDRFFFTVGPDYRVEVRPAVLNEVDGPMLVVGLQRIHGEPIQLPAAVAQRPDRDRLERRLEIFRRAS